MKKIFLLTLILFFNLSASDAFSESDSRVFSAKDLLVRRAISDSRQRSFSDSSLLLKTRLPQEVRSNSESNIPKVKLTLPLLFKQNSFNFSFTYERPSFYMFCKFINARIFYSSLESINLVFVHQKSGSIISSFAVCNDYKFRKSLDILSVDSESYFQIES